MLKREQMIEELVEYDFTNTTMVEVVGTYIRLKREFLDQSLSDEELTLEYISVFGDGEVKH